MFRIWIGNLGKYNEGELVGEWVDLPCDDFDAVYERIGISFDEPINGTWYEEIFIADFENDYGYDVGEYDNLEALNEVAETLESLDESEAEVWETLHDNGYNHDEIIRVLNDCSYLVYQDCKDMGDVAMEAYQYLADELERNYPLLSGYIDWDGVGRDLELNGSFYELSKTWGFVEIW